ncbi:MAG: LuxR family transcriptional regulator [Desulfobacterales bacterium]|nr:LuxR family transcriptional regulator [Desulfobacteraceae bacterium]MBT7085275.1 LuxR family transcriptional regulator [Desulfobacterales bacterium]MBT7698202.1 LuxR family transcriptional regulator [Desulfobacterales bacterium]
MSLWRIPFNNEIEPSKLIIALRERIKELNCLYAIEQLSERHSDSIDNLLQEIANFLPFSWQYPEITCARIVFKEKTYKSKGFKITKWRQSSRLNMYGEPVGEITIVYLEERPPADEGPFLKEESALLDALAQRIGFAAVRIYAELELKEINNQLLLERKALQEANTALRTVLARIGEEKQSIYTDIKANIDKILIPILHELTLHLPKIQRKYAEMLRTNLEDIVSPFVSHLSKNFLSLTSTEITICNMIRSGLQTKEIAQIRGVSMGTVNRHREHIRRKLKITNSDINLATYLQSNMSE